MTVFLAHYNAVLVLEEMQRAANFVGEFDPMLVLGGQDRWEHWRDQAHEAVFGSIYFDDDDSNTFVRTYPIPRTAEEAADFAERCDFSLHLRGQVLRDWFAYSVMIAACSERRTQLTKNEIEMEWERTARSRLGAPDGTWLGQNDRRWRQAR